MVDKEVSSSVKYWESICRFLHIELCLDFLPILAVCKCVGRTMDDDDGC